MAWRHSNFMKLKNRWKDINPHAKFKISWHLNQERSIGITRNRDERNERTTQIAHEVLRIFLQCSAIFDTVAYSQNVLRTFWGFLELLNILGTFQKLQIAILYFQKFTTFMHLFVPPPSRWSIIKYQHHRLLLPPLHCGHRDAPIDYVTTEFRWRQVACCVCVCVCRQVRQVAVALWQRRGQWKEENLVSIKILLKSIYFCFRHYECGN